MHIVILVKSVTQFQIEAQAEFLERHITIRENTSKAPLKYIDIPKDIFCDDENHTACLDFGNF